MLFEQITGFEDLKQTLTQAISRGQVAHAQLFVGAEGTPVLPLVLAYATYLNCQNRQPQDACGVCASCQKYARLVHPDLHLVFPVAATAKITKDVTSEKFLADFRRFVAEQPYGNMQDWASFFGAENKQLNIGVEESRNIVRVLSLKAYESPYKVLIIWLPELMNIQAANAILKILEEPPEKTLFLLASNSREKLMATILSRTQIVGVRPFDNDEITAYLEQKAGANATQAQQLAALSEGSMQRALRLLNEPTSDHFVAFRDWVRLCYGLRTQQVIEQTDEFQKLGREGQKSFFLYALHLVREALVWRLAGDVLIRLPEAEAEFIRNFSPFVADDNVQEMVDLLSEAYFHIERNAAAKIVYLDTSLKMMSCLDAVKQRKG